MLDIISQYTKDTKLALGVASNTDVFLDRHAASPKDTTLEASLGEQT